MKAIELSVVLPCLNEADTLADCIGLARQTMQDQGIDGEVVVADNGSRDASREIARSCGVRLVDVPQSPVNQQNGYGRGLMHGIAAASGAFVLMGDSDGSYDFREIPKFLAKLREGHDLVQGCRLPSGGGTIKPGAMPWTHRWIGNPLFSFLVRYWFGAPVSDVNCGMRAFRKDWFERMDFRCPGMEFASEMIIKAGVFGARVAEVPITLFPDGRKNRRPHLKTWRDGWRVLRLLFLYSPTWLFLVPGFVLVLLGLVGIGLSWPGVAWARVMLDANTLLFSSVFVLCGYQAVLYAILGRTFAMNDGLLPEQPSLLKFYRVVNLERGLLLGGLSLAAGLTLAIYAWQIWVRADFGELDYAAIMRITIPSALFVILGIQTVFMSFFASILGLGKRQQ